jgi:hypothetical protein
MTGLPPKALWKSRKRDRTFAEAAAAAEQQSAFEAG